MAAGRTTSWAEGVGEIFTCLDRTGDASGAWRFSSEAGRGSVLLERGRVCWAMSTGATRRLTEILCERHGLDPAHVNQVFHRCRAEQRPVGQTLVEEGLVAADQLADALRAHTTETMLILANMGPLHADWLPHRGGSYQPQFTFGRASMLADVAALGWGVDVAAAAVRLAAVLPPGTPGMAIVDKPGAPALPVVTVGLEGASTEDLLVTAAWATTAVRRAPSGRPAQLCAALGPGGGVVAWQDDLVCAALLEHPSDLPRVLARLTRRD